MEELFPAEVVTGKVTPKSTENTQIEWFKESDEKGSLAKATAQDIAFTLKWADEDVKEGWTCFNQRCSDTSPEVTSTGYMPIIQASAHEHDTLNTVVLKCLHVARKPGQQHVIITVDEALFSKLMELK